MRQPSNVSDDGVEALVEVLFLALPAMDGVELGGLLNAILRVVERERAQAAKQERDRWIRASAQ